VGIDLVDILPDGANCDRNGSDGMAESTLRYVMDPEAHYRHHRLLFYMALGLFCLQGVIVALLILSLALRP
jgi:hypothetical protein